MISAPLELVPRRAVRHQGDRDDRPAHRRELARAALGGDGRRRATRSSPPCSCCSASGMGLAMAPATDSIMGSLPREKAGVGSAVNDTTREVGGALGVAILGSILAASYSSTMAATPVVKALDAAGAEGAKAARARSRARSAARSRSRQCSASSKGSARCRPARRRRSSTRRTPRSCTRWTTR